MVPALRHAWQQRCRDNLRQHHRKAVTLRHRVKLHVAIAVKQDGSRHVCSCTCPSVSSLRFTASQLCKQASGRSWSPVLLPHQSGARCRPGRPHRVQQRYVRRRQRSRAVPLQGGIIYSCDPTVIAGQQPTNCAIVLQVTPAAEHVCLDLTAPCQYTFRNLHAACG